MVSLIILILAAINLVLLWLLYDARCQIDQYRKLAKDWQQTITRLELVAKDWARVARNYPLASMRRTSSRVSRWLVERCAAAVCPDVRSGGISGSARLAR
jgi:hypothetical protein